VLHGRRLLLIVGLMLSLFMASMESTVISTAMPTIVNDLGGLDRYSWVFSIYLLASTTTVPVFGKLSDIYGRTPVYLAGMGLFLLGSVLCGLATSMTQLIIYRAVQGVGAGGLLPLTFIIIGDSFTVEQRARVQGVFSSVWGVSSVVGPLLGGFLVDSVAWQWVFYINILPGIVAALMVWSALGQPRRAETRPAIDYAGALLLTFGFIALLLGLFELGTLAGGLLIGFAMVLLAALVVIERRAIDPIVPVALFRDRLFGVACLHGVLAGCAVFGSTAFVPLFVQASLGTSATAAGATLTPMLLSWVVASIISSRLLLRVNYRTLALIGMVLLTAGSFLLWQLSDRGQQIWLVVSTGLMGSGMGFSIPAFLIAVQSSVRRSVLGVATSTLQFTRSIGGTIGVSVMGVVLSIGLSQNLARAGQNGADVSLDSLLEPAGGSGAAVADAALRTALGSAIGGVFLIAFVAAALGLLATLWAPGGHVTEMARQDRDRDPIDEPAPPRASDEAVAVHD
jgi:EmrB/QacA subfamily drug resistance transporter